MNFSFLSHSSLLCYSFMCLTILHDKLLSRMNVRTAASQHLNVDGECLLHGQKPCLEIKIQNPSFVVPSFTVIATSCCYSATAPFYMRIAKT